MPNLPEIEPQREKFSFVNLIKSWRFWLSAGLGIGTVGGATITTIQKELSKDQASATEEIPGGQLPSTPISEEVSGEVVFTPIPKELPTPTAIKTPEPTATFIPAKPTEVLPAPATEPLKPSHEQTFSTGAVEKYDLVTEKNFNEHFAWVSEDELQKLIQEQPDLTPFPFTPLSETFSFGSLTKGIDETLVVYSDDVLVRSPIAGEVILPIPFANSPLGGIVPVIQQKPSKNKKYDITSAEFTTGSQPKLKHAQSFPAKGRYVEKGEPVFYSKGAKAFDSGGGYSAADNNLKVTIKNYTITGPKARDYIVETETPQLADTPKWVHTEDNKIALAKPS